MLLELKKKRETKERKKEKKAYSIYGHLKNLKPLDHHCFNTLFYQASSFTCLTHWRSSNLIDTINYLMFKNQKKKRFVRFGSQLGSSQATYYMTLWVDWLRMETPPAKLFARSSHPSNDMYSLDDLAEFLAKLRILISICFD